MNNKGIIGIVIVAVIVGGAFFIKNQYSAMPAQDATNQVQPTSQTDNAPVAGAKMVIIQSMAFSPATITVKVGDKVAWTNQDPTPHSATADNNSFNTGVLSQNQSGTVTFDKAGTFTYHCSVHKNMKATVIVTQ